MGAPCMECERKGCGSYHDKCERYREYKEGKYKVFEKKRKENAIREYKKDGELREYKKRRAKK